MKSKFRDQFNHSEWCLNDETGTRFLSHINITRTWGVKPAELTASQILQADSTDYMLGGSLTLKNGRIDKYLFDGGYAQATATGSNNDNFAFYYYNQDHLGNIREVVDASGTVKQVTNYYPFGAPYFDAASTVNADMQPYKYNGKELDRMHGLNTYDYGARQHDPILCRWDRIDPLCEKYYDVSPYVYCANNPVKYIDPDGKEKKEYLNNEDLEKSDYSLYPENTPGVLNIWAHGNYEKNYDEYAWGMSLGTHDADNASSFKTQILDNSKEWKKNDGQNLTIVLHSCGTSEFAKALSGDEMFKGKNITFIAPNAKLKTTTDRSGKKETRVKDKTYYNVRKGWKKVKTAKGQWMAYKDGKLVSALPANDQPGMKSKQDTDRLIQKRKRND